MTVDISALAIERGPETGQKETTDFSDSLSRYWQKNAMVQVIIDDSDKLAPGCTKYRGVWNMYFLAKKAYGVSAKKQLSNLFPAFFVIDFSAQIVCMPFEQESDWGKTRIELNKLCETHYLVLPITRLKESLLGGVDIKFLGMTIPEKYNDSGSYTIASYNMKVVEAYFYGVWKNQVADENTMKNFKSRTYRQKRGGEYLDLYNKYHGEIEDKIHRSMIRNMEEVGYAD